MSSSSSSGYSAFSSVRSGYKAIACITRRTVSREPRMQGCPFMMSGLTVTRSNRIAIIITTCARNIASPHSSAGPEYVCRCFAGLGTDRRSGVVQFATGATAKLINKSASWLPSSGLRTRGSECWRRPQIEPPCRRSSEPDELSRFASVTRFVGSPDWLTITSARCLETAHFPADANIATTRSDICRPGSGPSVAHSHSVPSRRAIASVERH